MRTLLLLLALFPPCALAFDSERRADNPEWNTVAPPADPAPAGKWDTTDKLLFAGFVVANAIDASQSVNIAKNPDQYYETNPLIGKHPSEGEIWLFKAAVVGGMYWLARDAKPAHRKIMLLIGNAIVLTAVNHNRTIGLHVRF